MEPTREQMKEYVRIWQENREILDRTWRDELRQVNTAAAMEMFQESFRKTLRDFPPGPSSGLVAWQEAMMKWKERLG